VAPLVNLNISHPEWRSTLQSQQYLLQFASVHVAQLRQARRADHPIDPKDSATPGFTGSIGNYVWEVILLIALHPISGIWVRSVWVGSDKLLRWTYTVAIPTDDDRRVQHE
jgi:hypothetical protein